MKNDQKINSISIDVSLSILHALQQMDKSDKRLLLVFEQDCFKSILSIGDIQRAILKGEKLDSSVSGILRTTIQLGGPDDSVEEIRNMMLNKRIECMPIVDADNRLINVYFWEDFFGTTERREAVNLNLPVVIMAGGKGTRLQPLTNVIPKPLIPIGDKTIIEEIMDRFVKSGCNQFFMSVNYKAETIKHYFEMLAESKYRISYFQETVPLGTAGSMHLLKDKITSTFFVSNCDIIINQELEEIYNYHKDNSNDITIVSAFKHYSIPYGTIETGENGVLVGLSEKPQITYQINTGVYILEPHVLNHIPEDKFYHITDLIDYIKNNDGKVGVFPISEGAWQDIGEWDEYLSFIRR